MLILKQLIMKMDFSVSLTEFNEFYQFASGISCILISTDGHNLHGAFRKKFGEVEFPQIKNMERYGL